MSIRRALCTGVILLVIPGAIWASTAKDLEKAAEKGQVAFVLMTEGKTADVSMAKAAIQGVTKHNKKSVMVELDRGKPENANVVAKYKLATIPAPMILVVNPNGTISGAVLPERATAEALAKMIPSPKKAEVVNALSDGNAVFITAYRQDMASVEAVNSNCAAACQQMAGKSVQVKVDMDDPAESFFLSEMKINTTSIEPVTVVANPQGQIAGTFNGDVQVAQLVTTATKKVGGCCPKTVSKPDASCGPTTTTKK
jgi:hypothetical protein